MRAALLALLASACVPQGDYAGTEYLCADDPTCPDGFTCESGVCVEPGGDTDGDKADDPDGADAGASAGDRIAVPAGTVRMGCDAGDTACPSDAQPARDVAVAAFSIDATEVTGADYAACVEAGACTEPGGDTGDPTAPVRFVSWMDAVSYCGFRGGHLPTEAEWERAARGGDPRRFPWGAEPADCTRAALADCVSQPVTVGTLDGAGPFGATDLIGNVSEWVADYYAADYYATAPSSNPVGPASGGERAVRGGSFLDTAADLATFTRLHADPLHRDADIGFRCAE
jgi:formylglycine-generating enzyme required for sulfatase activity